MDPATIAAGVVTLLVPLVKKTAEAFVGEAGPYVEKKAKLLWQKLQAKMEGNSASSASLKRFDADPETHLEEFKAEVEKEIAADPALGEELLAALADLNRKAPLVRVVQEVKQAEDLIGVRSKRIRSGTVEVVQRAESGRMVGSENEEIG